MGHPTILGKEKTEWLQPERPEPLTSAHAIGAFFPGDLLAG
jgi:hypothetical protein